MKVSLGPPLAERIGGRHSMEMEGTTVGEVLRNLSRAHEPLARLLWRHEGEFNPMLAVFRNKDQVIFGNKPGVRPEQGMDTPVAEGDEIAVISALDWGLAKGLELLPPVAVFCFCCGLANVRRRALP